MIDHTKPPSLEPFKEDQVEATKESMAQQLKVRIPENRVITLTP